jgi:phage recombination protein Bet
VTALALRDDQPYWDEKQLAVLRGTGIDEDVTEAELMTFLHECQRRKLDPFSRQIYLIGRKDKAKGRKVYRSQTSIDGFRLIARRAADRSGTGYSYEDTIWYDRKGGRHEVWLSPEAPAAAKVVVIRNGARFDAVARYGAYVQTDYEGNPLKMWKSMPDVMIAKCAEALALRKAFPEDLGGLYTDDEMAQADNPQRVTAAAEVVSDEPAGGAAWVDQATADAASARSVNAAWKIRNEAGEKAKAGQITWDEARRIKELAEARAQDIRQDTFDKAMRLLSQDEPWRDKIDELACGDDADAALAELEPMPDRKRQQRISHAIVAKAELCQWNLSDTEPVEAA